MSELRTYLSSDTYTTVAREYLDTVVLPAVASVQGGPVHTRSYVIAGKKVRVLFYSPLLAEKMSHALAHHPAAPEEETDLTVHAWDAASCGIMTSPWSNETFHSRETNARKESDGRFFGAYLYGEETLNLYDKDTKSAYFWIRDANALPDWVSAAPFRTIFHWFLSGQGIHLIHGACVGIDGSAVLLGAKGGSGKSTTALSCLLSGLDYLADDYVAIESESAQAFSLYGSVKITPDSVAAFPELSEKIWNTATFNGAEDKGKAVIFLPQHFPKQLTESAHLAAIFIPVIKSETRIVPASRAAALLALAPTILFQLPLASTGTLAELKRLIAKTPCYFLELGPDKRSVPQAIKDFLHAGTVQ